MIFRKKRRTIPDIAKDMSVVRMRRKLINVRLNTALHDKDINESRVDNLKSIILKYNRNELALLNELKEMRK